MFSWIEIYSGMNYEDFIRIENIMENNLIKIKTKVKSNRNRLSNDVVLGGNPLILKSADK